MFYDPMTVWYFAIFIMMVLAGVVFFSWVFMQEEAALAWWGVALLLMTLGLSGLIGRGVLPDFVSIEMANGMIVLATLCAWTGFRVFERQLPLWPLLVAGPMVWVILCQIPPFTHSIFARSLAMSLLLSCGMFGALRELWRGRKERMIARTAAIAIILGHTLLLLVRPLVVTDSTEVVTRTGQLLRDPYLAWYAHEWLTFLVLMTFTVIGMVRERREIGLHQASMIDELTGLLNRRGLMTRSVQICPPGATVSVLVLDLDRFKMVNDRHGHAGGDRLLAVFAEVLRSNVRTADVVARMGGEEFGVLMPGANSEAAMAGAERIRHAYRQAAHGLGMDGIDGTVSIGVASGMMAAGGFPESVGPLLARADIALYRAKALGRNRVEVFETLESTVVPLHGPAPRLDRRA